MSETAEDGGGGLRPLAVLAREITSGAVRLAAATAAWLRLVAEFDAREGWGEYGIRSCAHWLSWQCGLSPSAAREHVRVARALRVLPGIAAAFDGGRLSYAKVRALTRVAEPATEAALLEFADHATASQLDRTVRQWRRADAWTAAHPDRADEAGKGEAGEDGAGGGQAGDDVLPAARPVPREEFRYWWDEDGMLVVQARLSTENGAPFLAGLTSLVERAARRERAAAKAAVRDSAGPGPAAPPECGADESDADEADELDELVAAREATTARRCAALAALASAAADADRRAGDPPRREVVVHVDAAVLAEDAAAGRAYLEGGPALRPAQARRLLCEATVVTMLEAGREVLAHGRSRRLASRAQRRALLRRDGGCARPGCAETRPERLHAHHLRHWLFGGRTDLANLVLLCDTDHGLAHDLDLVMSRRDGQLIALTPDGRRVWGPADAAFTTGLDGLQPPAEPTIEDGAETPPPASPDPAFAGVHPIDTARGRRPAGAIPRHPAPVCRPTAAGSAAAGSTAAGSAAPDDAPDDGVPAATISRLLFPAGEPPLPDAMHPGGERMNVAYAVSVLIGHRDFVHRMATETGLHLAA